MIHGQPQMCTCRAYLNVTCIWKATRVYINPNLQFQMKLVSYLNLCMSENSTIFTPWVS